LLPRNDDRLRKQASEKPPEFSDFPGSPQMLPAGPRLPGQVLVRFKTGSLLAWAIAGCAVLVPSAVATIAAGGDPLPTPPAGRGLQRGDIRAGLGEDGVGAHQAGLFFVADTGNAFKPDL
jgi:hypothetical protein